MIELDKDAWDEFVCNFAGKLSVGCSIKDALNYFLDDYWTVLDTMANQAVEKEEVKESTEEYATKTYLREKNQIIWDYVYNLNREIGNLKKDVALLKESNAARTTPYGPVKYPNNIPMDWYKVTTQSNAQDNQPIKGLKNDTIATSGYMQVVDPRYTQEQIDEWNNIRYTPPEEC